jgi:curli biogenesis system outer membrane secretion channel CsgG
MRTPLAAVLLLAVCLVGCGSKNALPTPTATGQTAASQTLASQIVNNTSAASNFVNQTNGNLGANNVSKLDVHSLLYSGATTGSVGAIAALVRATGPHQRGVQLHGSRTSAAPDHRHD